MPRSVTATGLLAGVTAVASLWIMLAGDPFAAAIGAGFIPARVVGTVMPDDILVLPVWLTPLSATLIHAGPLHLLLNLMMLIVTGRDTERVTGPGKLILLYGVGAYAAAFAQWLPDPGSATPMVGASGAISAVVGGYALLFGRTRARAIGPVPAHVVHVVWLIAGWTIVNFLFAFALGTANMPIAWMAHVGGFVAGVTLTPLLVRRRTRHA